MDFVRSHDRNSTLDYDLVNDALDWVTDEFPIECIFDRIVDVRGGCPDCGGCTVPA